MLACLKYESCLGDVVPVAFSHRVISVEKIGGGRIRSIFCLELSTKRQDKNIITTSLCLHFPTVSNDRHDASHADSDKCSSLHISFISKISFARNLTKNNLETLAI